MVNTKFKPPHAAGLVRVRHGIVGRAYILRRMQHSRRCGTDWQRIRRSRRRSKYLSADVWEGRYDSDAIHGRFIPTIDKATEVKKISPTQTIWTLYYTFPLPISPRVFTVLQVTQLTLAPRTGLVFVVYQPIPLVTCHPRIIISIPIDLTSEPELLKLEEKGVKGRYVAVERILELDDGKVEWKMATSSAPGGNIPAFVSERSLPGQIAGVR
jgi:hypothetical protein